jgi:hypothetical protein
MCSKLTIASLNAWAGCAVVDMVYNYNHVVKFLVETANKVDVFCLQEVHYSVRGGHQRFIDVEKPGHRIGPIDTHLGNRIEMSLCKTHHVFFTPHFNEFALHDYQSTDLPIQYGNMMIIKKGINIVRQSFYLTYGDGGLSSQVKRSKTTCTGQPASRRMQMMTMAVDGQLLTIANLHGLHSKLGKDVSVPAHLSQASQIKRGLIKHSNNRGIGLVDIPKLLVGDFNLVAGMAGFDKILEGFDYSFGKGVDLNSKYGITDTRTALYPKDKAVRVADYAISSSWFVDKIVSYTTEENVPSDHKMLQLILKI